MTGGVFVNKISNLKVDIWIFNVKGRQPPHPRHQNLLSHQLKKPSYKRGLDF